MPDPAAPTKAPAPGPASPAPASPGPASPGPASPGPAEPRVVTAENPAAAAAQAASPAAAESPTTDITAGQGGVMTDEVGVITGDLTLRTEFADGKVTVRVQYKDADEWYVVTGGRAQLKDPADIAAVHKIVAGILTRPED